MMTHSLLISADELAPYLDHPNWVVVDCRFDLNDPSKGRHAYREGHIPGALYAHLDDDLSGPIVVGETGRHPLPEPDVFAARLSQWGIDDQTQVVVYDDAAGLYAGRLWWMLRWLGHDAVALLDGGWQQWVKNGHPTARGEETRAPRTFVPHVRAEMTADAGEVLANLENDEYVLVDVRDEARFRGEVTGLDPVGGHIPGAISAHYAKNLTEDGKFKSPDELRAYYTDLLADPDAGVVPEDMIFYCGSGVSAAHDLLAMELAGLGRHRLYVGSWSHWITDPTRPVATGDAG